MPITQSDFKPAWWLPNPHLQTLWPSLCRRRAKISIERQRVELADGDFIDLDWVGKNENGPLLIVLHGLGGSINSHYASNVLSAISNAGWRGVLMHFRGCSGEPNRLARSYHSGETGDFREILSFLQQKELDTPLYALGFSLGGNVLLKYLGEQGTDTPLRAAVAVCVPMDLLKAVDYLQTGFSRFYQWYLVGVLRQNMIKKASYNKQPLPVQNIDTLRTFLQFDDAVTAPLHGFDGVYDYYAKASSRPYIKAICVQTLIIHASDDPFMSDVVLPDPHDIPACVNLEISPGGGHVGFVEGNIPGVAKYWLEDRITKFLKNC